MKASDVGGDVNVDDITVPQLSHVRNAMTNDFVDRGANAFGKRVVVQWRRIRVTLHACLVGLWEFRTTTQAFEKEAQRSGMNALSYHTL